ncbi:MFS transporter [Sphingomonas sp. HITSZ_GF]|uniref:MFS transporter n=1 Tax=Sphingomonas sp. HITSZ_GF TaxID=3037247 RepID=UPI00240DDDD3|nr:MFS transporter [Sphingomonas sp. HITSZ_GF]MDG2534230.1 MFS transporter [Sphingomonas sp. HITSZ_GF]
MPEAAPEAAARPSGFRWLLLGCLFAATVLNYLDRQTLSILAPLIQRDLKMSDAGYAGVVQLFLLAYTFAYLTAGWITDRLGSKLSLALFVGWWSLANMATGLVHSVIQLGAARFALGLGEAGNYTAAPKAVSERFPVRERGLALGIYTSGAMIGATIAPPLIGWIALSFGWRAAFLVTGGAGLVWLAAWLIVHRFLPPSPAAAREALPGEAEWSWRQILSSRQMWSLALARTLTDPVWYFYLFWFPKYLADARGLGLLAVASLAWIVYLAADLGSVGGGWLSGRLTQRGWSPARARLAVMGLAALIAPFGALIATSPAIPLVLALGAVVALAHMGFLVNLSTLIVDIFPRRQMATIFGIIAAGSGLGGMASTWVVGQFAGGHNYPPLFLAMAVLHPLGWAVARLALPKGEKHAA